MRIAFVVHAYVPTIGGAESYAEGLAVACAGFGHEVHVITPASDSAEVFYEFGHPQFTTSTEIADDVTVHRIAMKPSWWSRHREGPYPIDTAHKVWRKYRESVHRCLGKIHPQSIVTLPHAFPNVEAALSTNVNAQRVYVPMLHESDPQWDPDRIRPLIQMADTIIALTHWERTKLIQSYGSQPSSTVVIPPGVSAPDRDDVEAWPSDPPYVLALGRRSASKNLSAIAQAIKEVRAGGIDLELLVVGPGSDAETDAQLTPFLDFVRLRGPVNEGQKWSAIKGAIATVSMSDQESYGIAGAEASAMGTPSIALRTSISSELAETDESQILVNDVAELTDAIRRLVASGALPESTDLVRTRGRRQSWEESAELLIGALGTDPP